MASSSTEPANGELSAAQRLQQQHAEAAHHATVEDAVDEDLPLPSGQTTASSEATQKKLTKASLDTQSQEAFPELGASKGKAANVAPIWGAKTGANGSSNGNGTPRSSQPSPGIPSSNQGAKPAMVIPGRHTEKIELEPQYVLQREKLRRPIPDTIKDLNRKSRATITMSTAANGRLRFEAAGPPEVAQQALRDLVQQIGTKQTIKVSIPASTRAHIIGKGGSTIRALQEKTGARIQLPKIEDASALDDDDEATIDVIVEGNAVSAESARLEINKIAGERSSNAQTKVKGIPAAFYPFIAGHQNALAQNLEENNGIQIRVPPHQAFSTAPVVGPSSRPQFVPAEDNHIQLAGDRAAVQKVRSDIERQAAELAKLLEMEQLSIQRGRHQFIIGDRGVAADDFFGETGCAILLPTDEEDDLVTVIGPNDRLAGGVEKAMDLAMGMQMSNFDISRFHRTAPIGAAVHAGLLTRYLRQRKEIQRLEKLYNTHINTPLSSGGALPWELYSREGKNAIRAQSEITGIINAHPPSRLQPVKIDPFFHQHLRNDITPKVRKDFGVQIVVPEAAEGNDAPVLLVYEGLNPSDGQYELPRNKPDESQIKAFKQGLEDAQKHILDLINKQEQITTAYLDVPAKFHERLRRFIKKEQESRSSDQIPVRVSSRGTTITLRGPESAVNSLAAKIEAFVEQEKQDDKERGFTLTFDFPQKFANHLIGKGGSNIKELRDKYDVEIQVQDGKVELKGPKAKAEAAQKNILNLGRTLEDEVTRTLKIDPKYHRELIGAQGAQINRLQTRYNVLIFFPRSAKAADNQSVTDAASEVEKKGRQQKPDEVIIRGPKKGADEAYDEINALFKWLAEHSHSATVAVQQKQVGSLIGQGGAALDELRTETGTKIDVPSDRDTPIVEIVIRGTAAGVTKAKKILEEKRAVFDDTVVQTVEVDKKHHKALIGASGATLRDIVVQAGGSDDRRELARTIQFPKQDADGNAIKVEGRTELVSKIIKRIEEIVAERESQVTETVDVAVDQHRSLIGRGGDVKRQMESQFSVSIDVPRQGGGQTGVKITGRPENVEKAKEHIQTLVKSQQGETVQVPRNAHHAISNGGQFFRQLRNNHQVTVDHAGQALPAKPDTSRANGGSLPLITDDDDANADAHSWKVVNAAAGEAGEIPWVLRGTPENVAKAKEAIAKALEQAQKNDATGYLVLPDPSTYRFVIGPNGTKVNQIRKQSNCKIQVPRDQAKDEAIEIIGTTDGVESAKDLILAAVREGLTKARE